MHAGLFSIFVALLSFFNWFEEGYYGVLSEWPNFLRQNTTLGLFESKCSNPRYSWITYFILSNLCNFSQLNSPLVAVLILLPYQSFVVLSTFCHFLTLCYILTFYVIYTRYKCTYCTHHKHNNPLPCLIVRTLSALIQFPNSSGLFDPCAILLWGDRDMAGGFL